LEVHMTPIPQTGNLDGTLVLHDHA
jgi:hypothetical protein